MKRRRVGAVVVGILAVIVAGVTVFAGTTKTAHSYDNPFRSDDDRYILNWAGYELPNNWNLLMKDVDTLFSKATGTSSDSIYKTAVKAIRVRADSGTIPILTGSVAIRTNVTADSGRSAKAWSAPRIRGDSATIPILTGNVTTRGAASVDSLKSTKGLNATGGTFSTTVTAATFTASTAIRGGSLYYGIASPTGKYSVTASDAVILASANDSAQYLDTITLPACSSNKGRVLMLVNCSDGDTGIVIKPDGSDKVDGFSYDTLHKANDNVTYLADSAAARWRLLSTHTH